MARCPLCSRHPLPGRVGSTCTRHGPLQYKLAARVSSPSLGQGASPCRRATESPTPCPDPDLPGVRAEQALSCREEARQEEELQAPRARGKSSQACQLSSPRCLCCALHSASQGQAKLPEQHSLPLPGSTCQAS